MNFYKIVINQYSKLVCYALYKHKTLKSQSFSACYSLYLNMMNTCKQFQFEKNLDIYYLQQAFLKTGKSKKIEKHEELIESINKDFESELINRKC